MQVVISKILRQGKKSVRVLLSNGSEVVLSASDLHYEGESLDFECQDFGAEIRPLLPTDPPPRMLRV